jgi:multidrug efflux pump subunit AcrB
VTDVASIYRTAQFRDRPVGRDTVCGFAGDTRNSCRAVSQHHTSAGASVDTFPGANAQDVANAVAGPIEAEVNGVDDMLYMESTSSDGGGYSLTITFAVGTDPDKAAVNVQNRVSLAVPRLPAEVNELGVSTKKRASNILLGVNLTSPGGTHDAIFLSNYTTINVRDALTRVNGVGEATVLGALDYSMRIWLNLERMNALGITASDVTSALGNRMFRPLRGNRRTSDRPEQQQQLSIVVQCLCRLPGVREYHCSYQPAGRNCPHQRCGAG